MGFFGLALASCAGVGSVWSMEISIPVVILASVVILRLSRSDGRLNGDAACAVVSTGAVAVFFCHSSSKLIKSKEKK